MRTPTRAGINVARATPPLGVNSSRLQRLGARVLVHFLRSVRLLNAIAIPATAGCLLPVNPAFAQLQAATIEDLLDAPAAEDRSERTTSSATVTIVTQDDMRKLGYRSLSDVLKDVEGFNVTSDRVYSFLGLRGFSRPGDFGGRVTLSVDGHIINDPLFHTVALEDDFVLDMDLIERIEIERGPNFAHSESNPFFGAINVVTRRASSLKGAEASARVKSFGTYHGRLSYGNTFDNGVEALLSASTTHSDGPSSLYYPEFDTPDTNNGIARNLNASQSQRVYGSLAYQGFTFRSAYVTRDRDNPTAPFANQGTGFNEPGTTFLDQRYYADLSYLHSFDPTLHAKARLYYDMYNFVGDYMGQSSPDFPQLHVRNPSSAEWLGGELQLAKQIQQHNVLFGVQFRDVFKSIQRSGELTTRTPLADVHEDWSSVALILQDEYRISDRFAAQFALRYDHYSFFGDAFNPKLALTYRATPRTSFKLIYGESFRPPNDFERAFTNIAAKANPNLQPETIRTVELVADYLPFAGLRLGVVAYRNQVDDLITQTIDADGLPIYVNLSNARTWGTDFEVEAQLSSGWRGKVSHTWQTTEDSITGETLRYAPSHLTKLQITAPLYLENLFAGLQVQYSSGVTTLRGSEISGHCLTHLNIYSKNLLVKGLEFSAGAFNLFDVRYASPARPENRQDLIAQDGRTYQLTLRYHY